MSGVGVGEASQYISVIVDATDNEDVAVLYVCVFLDGCDREKGEVEECTEGGEAVGVDG